MNKIYSTSIQFNFTELQSHRHPRVLSVRKGNLCLISSSQEDKKYKFQFLYSVSCSIRIKLLQQIFTEKLLLQLFNPKLILVESYLMFPKKTFLSENIFQQNKFFTFLMNIIGFCPKNFLSLSQHSVSLTSQNFVSIFNIFSLF